jgi:hypothetical protein
VVTVWHEVLCFSRVFVCVCDLQLLAIGMTWFLKRHPAVYVNLAVFELGSSTVLRCQCARYGLKGVAVVVSEKLHLRCNVRGADGIARIEG